MLSKSIMHYGNESTNRFCRDHGVELICKTEYVRNVAGCVGMCNFGARMEAELSLNPVVQPVLRDPLGKDLLFKFAQVVGGCWCWCMPRCARKCSHEK